MLELCEDYRENVRRVDTALRVDQNYDLIKKVIYLGKDEMTLYYIDGFVDGGAMNKMIIYFLSLKGLSEGKEHGESAARWFLEHHVPYVEAEVTADPHR